MSSNTTKIKLQPKLTPVSFSPTSIGGCQLWLDAADKTSASMTLSGSAVTVWCDKSGNSNATTTTTGSPTQSATGISLTSNDNFYMDPLNNPPTRSYLTFFTVATLGATGGGTYGRLVSFAKQSDGTNNYDYSTTPNFTICQNNGAQITIFRNGSNVSQSVTYGTPFLISIVWDGIYQRIYFNGTSLGSTSSSAGFGFNRLGIGVNINTKTNPGDRWGGTISEIIMYYSAFTTTAVQTIESYLAQKWGLASYLPTGHPGRTTILYGLTPLPITTVTPLTTTTFTYTGSSQTYTVPGGVTSIIVYLWGAGGQGSATDPYANYGGAGAFVQGVLSVTPGATLTIIVGQGGYVAYQNPYGGGGRAYQADGKWYGSSGGGRSAIQITGGTDAVVAGGGGGHGGGAYGGAATFSGTAAGGWDGGTGFSGLGGSQTAGGAGGTTAPSAGSTGTSQNGGNGTTSSYGGGGGGGYYGGGGGGYGGGGGGSSYTGNLSLIPGQTTFGSNSPDGRTAPATTLSVYGSGAAVGGPGLVFGSSGSGNVGGNGLVVIQTFSSSRLLPTKILSILKSASFSPTSIGACSWWLDATDPLGSGTKPTLNSSLGTWYDKSGNGRNATASSSASYTAQGILFTSGNYYTMTVPYSSNYSIFLVATNTSVAQCYFFARNSLGGGRGPTFIQGYIGSGIGLEWYEDSDRATIVTTPSSTFMASVSHTQGTNITGYYFGAQAFSITQTRTYASNAWDILGQSGINTNYYGGYMKELIFFSRVLTTSERQNVEAYLAQKWGLLSSLPAGHPALAKLAIRIAPKGL